MRDAERLPWRRVDEDAVRPLNPRVWIRLDGEWRQGTIVFLRQMAGGGWGVWLQHDSVLYPSTAWSEHGWFRYNPETIRQREGRDPPEE